MKIFRETSKYNVPLSVHATLGRSLHSHLTHNTASALQRLKKIQAEICQLFLMTFNDIDQTYVLYRAKRMHRVKGHKNRGGPPQGHGSHMDLDFMDHYDSVVEVNGEDVSMGDSEVDKV